MSWSRDLQRITERGKLNLLSLNKAVKIAVFSEIVQTTRVREGRLKGNWQIQENTPAVGELARKDPRGSAVLNEVTHRVTGNGLTYFTNNLPYARVYEIKDAMVGRAVRLIRRNVANEARKLR